MSEQIQLKRYGLFDTKVPRYTSYPPATQFAGGVNAAVQREWIESIAPGTKLSLYMHVPFCRRLCWFCACRTQGVRSDEPVRAYVDSLLQEIATLKSMLPSDVSLARLHWGGGTPTLLAPDMIARISDAFQDIVRWEPDAEFSVEIDPNEIDQARLKALKAGGMNRASIGVQDFNPDIQKIIGRIQSYETTRDVVDALRDLGVKSLNADILFGLPEQSPERLAESVQLLLSLTPDRVALYGYAHVPWMARRQGMIPTDTLPTPEERLQLYENAKKLFLWDGYKEIGIDHFARADDGLAIARDTGRLRRNFQGYTDDTCDVLIGLGASSISKFPQGFSQNISATAGYQSAVRAGELATARGHVFTADDKFRGRIIEALMCDFEVETADIVSSFGVSEDTLNRLYTQASNQFAGMVEITPTHFRIRPQARPLVRMIARVFDAYDISQGSHSAAI